MSSDEQVPDGPPRHTIDDLHRLGKAVRDRRLALDGLTQAQVADRGGPSTETLRLIENARQLRFGERTLLRLDRALDWPAGTSKKILEGVAINDAEDGAPTDDDWRRLGKAVEDRRFECGYSQEQLVKRGGPSHQTVRNIERGKPTSYRPVTFRKLDRALDWADGTALKILQGTADQSDLDSQGDPDRGVADALRPDFSKILDRLVREGKIECGFLQHADGIDMVINRLDRPLPASMRVRLFSPAARAVAEIPELDALFAAGAWRVMGK